ncbi:calcium and integrin-binding protein 1-like [Uloborus diversus]|uniref:calcium and integrin-binding protein 1-like n=1 Tax=Uloborus diversus TaxID=327109 RepID=UPI00240906FC|nr:calcium and integrin-binding protein 1-like [Uloborus diversus]
MGNTKSQLTKSELQDYKELTYLTEKEIQYAFKKFKNLDVRVLNKNKFARISTDLIKGMPEFENNPFADRICRIFSSENDGRWSFDDFLDMVSVFNENTPAEEKAMYAFYVYDFDEDGFLSTDDLTILFSRLAGGEKIEERDMRQVLSRILEEADLDRDGMLSPAEFKHSLMKCPDFAKSFTLRI